MLRSSIVGEQRIEAGRERSPLVHLAGSGSGTSRRARSAASRAGLICCLKPKSVGGGKSAMSRSHQPQLQAPHGISCELTVNRQRRSQRAPLGDMRVIARKHSA